MEKEFKNRKENVLDCLKNIKNEFTKPTFHDMQTGPIFYLNEKSVAYNGFLASIFKQIQTNISEDYRSISNLSFVLEAWTEDYLICFGINQDFIQLFENFTNDVKKTNDKNELETYFNKFKANAKQIYSIAS